MSQVGLLGYRSLIWNFAQRDLKARFKGTIVGWGWSLIVPLASLLIYTLVTHVFFRFAPPDFGNGRKGNPAAYLFAGLTVWSFFANSINTAVYSLLGAGVLLKKIYFPAYTPVLGSMVAVAIQTGIELGLVFVVFAALFHNVGVTWILIPLWAVLMFGFVAGLSQVLAIANVYFRDLGHIISVALQLLFYASPIIFQPTQIPLHYHGVPIRSIIMSNPVSQFVEIFRDISYSLTWGSLGAWGYVAAWTVAMVVLARWIYLRNGRDLGEQV